VAGFPVLYRLTNETVNNDPAKNNGSVIYGLDPVGNRLSSNSTLNGINSGIFAYNADDELSTESYDAEGNTTNTGGKSLVFDSENHLISVNGGAIRYVYDGDGIRVAKIVNGVTTQYLVDDLNPTGYPQVVEELVGGSVQRTYAYGLQRISQNQIIDNQWVTSYYGYDGAGNVRQLTNMSGAVTDTYDYDAFGNVISKSGATPNNYLYRGEQFDPDLGMYYLRARYYNPMTGRFLSRDPEDGNPRDPVSLHKYLYVGGDPVNAIDPHGREEEVEYVMFSTEIAVGTTHEVTVLAIGIAGVYCKIAGLLAWATSHNWIGSPGSFDLPEPFRGYCAIFH
jgi:RHS repeat-associated protein